MYDTIHLWLPEDRAGAFNRNESLKHLAGLTEHYREDGQIYTSGTLGNNYRVNISSQGISLKGSLAKYYLNDNLKTLTRQDSARAVERLADELCLPIQLAKVTRVDVGQNILVRYDPKAYYPYLGDCQYYNRLTQGNAVYWANGSRTKLVYNKIAEAKKNGMTLPAVWDDQNVLRYEMRFTSRICKHLHQPEINASTLSMEKFYMAMVHRWVAEYEAIHKINQINLNLDTMKSPKDFIRQMALIQITQIGQAKAMELVEDLRAKGAFEKPEYYSRLKKEIRQLCNSPAVTSSSDLIVELDKKVNAAKRYCR